MNNDKLLRDLSHGNPAVLKRMTDLIGTDLKTALDIAADGGDTAVKLAESADNVTSINMTPEMFNAAREMAADKGITNIEFMPMDVHQMAFPDESFDVVTSMFAAHHFNDIRTALAEMTRVLKTGGKMYILDCSVIDGDIIEAVINHVELLRDSSHKCSYSSRQWEQLLQELPLEIERFELLREEYELPQWFDQMGTPQEKRDEIFCYIDSLTPTLRRYYPYSQMFLTTYRIEILARKKY